MNNVQSCTVYGLPPKEIMPALTESEAFRFGYCHALQGRVAIYMGQHIAAFESGCKHGQEMRAMRQELEALRNQRDGLEARVLHAIVKAYASVEHRPSYALVHAAVQAVFEHGNV